MVTLPLSSQRKSNGEIDRPDGTISGRIAKDVFAEMLETGKQAADIVEEKGLRQVSDTGEIEAIIDKVIADSPEQLAAYKAGKENLFGYFVGQVMKATGGKANPCRRRATMSTASSRRARPSLSRARRAWSPAGSRSISQGAPVDVGGRPAVQRRMRAQFVIEVEPGTADALGVVPVREVARRLAPPRRSRHEEHYRDFRAFATGQ